MKIYLSGKITGCSDYKERFADMQRRLEAIGYEVFNPCIFPSFMEYEQYMSLDFLALSFMDAIFLMDNWEVSRGARREKLEAEKLGLKILTEKHILAAETMVKLCEDSESVADFAFEMDKDEESHRQIHEMSRRIKDAIKENEVYSPASLFLAVSENFTPEEKRFIFEEFVRDGDEQISTDLEVEMTNTKIRERYQRMIDCSKRIEERFASFRDIEIKEIA